jgi:hypothetical protein
MKIMKSIITLSLLAVCMSASAQQTIEMNLWSNGAPNSNGDSTDSAKIRIFLPVFLFRPQPPG